MEDQKHHLSQNVTDKRKGLLRVLTGSQKWRRGFFKHKFPFQNNFPHFYKVNIEEFLHLLAPSPFLSSNTIYFLFRNRYYQTDNFSIVVLVQSLEHKCYFLILKEKFWNNSERDSFLKMDLNVKVKHLIFRCYLILTLIDALFASDYRCQLFTGCSFRKLYLNIDFKKKVVRRTASTDDGDA
jgi:hypothetical protein